MKLTLKQENFCLAYIETGNATEAYESAYKPKSMTKKTMNEKGSRMLAMGKIRARIQELTEPVREKALLTLESHLERLNHLSLKAEASEQYGAAIKAEESRGKVMGLYVAKIDHTSSDGTMSPKQISEEELKAELDRLGFGKKSQLDEKVKQ